MFLDRTVTRIIALDEVTHKATEYPGNYSDYLEEVDRALDNQWATRKDQQAEVRRIEADIRSTKERALVTERATTNDHYRRKAKNVAKKAKVRERRLQKTLDSNDLVDKPKEKWELKLDFGSMTRGG